MAARWDADPRGGIDTDTLYTRCPDCGLIGPAGSAEYTMLPGPAGTPDWSRPVTVGCAFCGHRHAIGQAAVLERDQVATCTRQPDLLRPEGCSARTPYPSGAARVCCTTCRLLLRGPDLDAPGADQLRATEALHGLELQATLRQARGRGPAEGHRRAHP
jgi:hypothetical protein